VTRAAAFSRPRARTWLFALGAVMLVGLGVRLFYIQVHDYSVGEGATIVGDPYWYHGGANLLAEGRGFLDPVRLAYAGRSSQSAAHPPGYTVALSAASVLGFKSVFAHQVWSALMGTATIGVVGIVGRRLAGSRAGLLAAGLAAVYPSFWFHDALLMSETLVLLTVAVTLLVAYWFWQAPNPRRAVVLGLACGVTALTRSETVILLVLLVVPLAAFQYALTWRRRILLISVTWLAAVITIAPWAVYNSTRLQHPVVLSTPGHTLLSGNCPDIYEGDLVGYWTIGCLEDANDCPADRRGIDCFLYLKPGEDPSTQSLTYQRAAFEHMRENLGRLPFVVFAREGRTWGFYRPNQQLSLDTFSSREIELSRLGLGMYYALATGFIAGVVILRRRRVPIFPLLALIVSVVLSVSVTIGETRYRAVAEVPLVVGAAVALDAAIARVLDRRRRREPEDQRPEEAKVPVMSGPTQQWS
jgi:4-amino-4-deoxy-L-arabinose transferase-like glycosyltransferase